MCINFDRPFTEAFFGEYYDQNRFKVVNDKGDVDAIINSKSSRMRDIYRQLPHEWRPDVIFVLWPEWNTLPQGLFLEEIPIVAFISDWNLAFSNIQNHIHLYDCVFMDKKGTELFRNMGNENVYYAPLYSFDPKIHYPNAAIEKDIDISLVGNLTHNVQVERIEWLKRMVMLRKKGINAQIVTHAFGEDYTKILQRSKIVFNRGIRAEMNLRAYEAPAAGALLMMEIDNNEVYEHLAPFDEFVPYDRDNFEDLVIHYSEHDDERERISAKGHDAIISRDSYTHHFSIIMDKINELAISQNLLVRKRQLSEVDYKGLLTHTFNSTRDYRLDIGFKLLEEASFQFDINASPWWLNAKACLHFIAALELEDSNVKVQAINLSISLWERSINLDRNYFLSVYNLFKAMVMMNQDSIVENMEPIIIESCITSDLKGFNGLVLLRNFNHFLVESERARYSAKLDRVVQSNLVNVYLSDIYEELGKFYERTGRLEKAIQSLNQAVSHRFDNVEARFLLSKLLLKNNQLAETVLHLRTVISMNPFHVEAALSLCSLLKLTGPQEEFTTLVQEYLLIADTISLYSGWRSFFEGLLDS